MELPHRFVPTTSKFVSPVKIVSQFGHTSGISVVSFSPCAEYFASADTAGWVRIWSLETLDILGIYRLDFDCEVIEWDSTRAIICRNSSQERRIEINKEANEDAAASDDAASNNIIRLIGEPEASRDGDTLKITYNDNVFEHPMPGLINFSMDPCERYVAAASPDRVVAFSAFEDDEIIAMDAPKGKKWCGIHMFWRGSYFSALLDDGSIYTIDPINKKINFLYAGNNAVTAWDFSKNELLIFGDGRGTLTIYDITERSILLRTPRCHIPFSAVYPSSEKTGFVALRSESASAFLCQSQEILSASPLPAPLCASCPGSLYSELIVACADQHIYRLKLDDNSISKICRNRGESVDLMAASGSNLLFHCTCGSYAFHDGKSLAQLDWKSAESPKALAVSENGKTLAALYRDHIELFDRTGKQEIQNIAIENAAQIAFGKEKTANSLLIFKSDLSISAIDIRSCEIKDLNRLAIDHAEIISVAPAAKSYVFVLLAAEHGQLAIMKVGLNSGKSNLVLRVFVVGTQIWGAAETEESVYLRSDATCLRIISDLKAFSVEDWSRSEPLALF